MSNIDKLVKRLRARVVQSAQRERSLDWLSADTLDKLHAENITLREERDSLSSMARSIGEFTDGKLLTA